MIAMKIAIVRATPRIEPPMSWSRVDAPTLALGGCSKSIAAGEKRRAWSPGAIPAF